MTKTVVFLVKSLHLTDWMVTALCFCHSSASYFVFTLDLYLCYAICHLLDHVFVPVQCCFYWWITSLTSSFYCHIFAILLLFYFLVCLEICFLISFLQLLHEFSHCWHNCFVTHLHASWNWQPCAVQSHISVAVETCFAFRVFSSFLSTVTAAGSTHYLRPAFSACIVCQAFHHLRRLLSLMWVIYLLLTNLYISFFTLACSYLLFFRETGYRHVVYCCVTSLRHLGVLFFHWTMTWSSCAVHWACLFDGKAQYTSALRLLYSTLSSADAGESRCINVLIIIFCLVVICWICFIGLFAIMFWSVSICVCVMSILYLLFCVQISPSFVNNIEPSVK